MPTTQRLREHPLVLQVYLPFLIYAFSYAMLIPILPFYAGEFDVPYIWVGVLLAGASIGRLLGDMPAGTLPRRWGTKRTLITGLSIVGVGVISLFWVQTIALAILLLISVGIGQAMYLVTQHSFIVESTPNAQRGRAIAVYGGMFRIARLLAPALAGFLAVNLGIRVVFLLAGIGCAISVFVLWAFQTPPTEKPKPTPAKSQAQRSIAVLKSHRRILSVAGLAQLFGQLTRAGRVALIPLFASDVLGLSVDAVGIIISVSVLFEVALFYPSGIIMDRWGRKFAIVPCFALQALGLALVPFTTDFMSLLLVASFAGFGNGIGSGTMMTLGADLSPTESRAEFIGIWRLIGDSGAMFGPMIIGVIADIFVLQYAPFAIAITGLMASGIFYNFVPETLIRRKNKPKVTPA